MYDSTQVSSSDALMVADLPRWCLGEMFGQQTGVESNKNVRQVNHPRYRHVYVESRLIIEIKASDWL